MGFTKVCCMCFIPNCQKSQRACAVPNVNMIIASRSVYPFPLTYLLDIIIASA